jgi:hypothetical protein
MGRSFGTLIALGFLALVLAADPNSGQSTVEEVLVPTSERAPQMWTFAFEERAVNWFKESYSDDDWEEGKAAFGPVAGTKWTGGDVYVRRWFRLSEVPERIGLRIRHSGEAKIYINTYPIAHYKGASDGYVVVPLETEHLWILRRDENLIAVHCRHEKGEPFLDVGLVRLPPASSL